MMFLRGLWQKICGCGAAALLAFLCLPLSVFAQAQSTAFTYQGRLNFNDAGATGIYDFTFGLFNTNTGGAAVGIVTNNSIVVTSGLFVTTMDFGRVFQGAPAWLEIGVRSHGSPEEFITLYPRQNLLATPYALYAQAAGGFTTNLFTGDGGGLTNVNVVADHITGLGSMAFQSTNGPAFNQATNAGTLTVAGNLALTADVNDPAPDILIPRGGQIYWTPSDGTAIWYNYQHTIEPELQFSGGGSASFTFGEDRRGKATVHFGGSGPYHTFFHMQYDEDRMNATNPILGYSNPFGFTLNVWSNSLIAHHGAWQFQALDTNGNNILYWWDKWGQFPGYNQVQQEPVGHIAGGLTANSIVWGGASLTNAVVRGLATAVTGTNYSIDFGPNAPDFLELNLITNLTISITNLNLAAQAQKKEVIIRSPFAQWNLGFPADWIWESESGSASAPISLAAGRLIHLTLLAEVNTVTNIYSRASFSSYTPLIDADAASFFAAAGVTDEIKKTAVNQLCLNLKAHGSWNKLVAFYPFVGDSGNGAANRLDLKRAHNILWHGPMIHDANGITGDGVGAYGDTGIIPADVFASANSGMLFVWIKGPASPSTQGWFMGVLGFSPEAYFGLGRSDAYLALEGLNVLSGLDTTLATGPAGFTGFAGGARVSNTQQYLYLNGNLAASFTNLTAAGLSGAEAIYILAKNEEGTVNHFSNANLSAAGIGQNFSTSDMAQLIQDISGFEAALGR